MDVSKIPPGEDTPRAINVLIEVPLRADPIKYEFDKTSGAIFVDRYLDTPMFYPWNYGFIPNTLADDGDPVDVMVVGRMPVIPGAVLPARPIGVLRMEDEAGMDEKILAVPLSRITPLWHQVRTWHDLQPIELGRIVHFFEHYKDLEPGKWTRRPAGAIPRRPSPASSGPSPARPATPLPEAAAHGPGRAAATARSRPMVRGSSTPSTRCGAKRRWNARSAWAGVMPSTPGA